MLHQGLIDETTDGYSVLKLNVLSWEVLRKQRKVEIALSHRPAAAPESQSAGKANAEMLFEQLRKLRKQLADEQSVAPYVVFADSSLRLMAQIQPQSLEAFSQISGVGSHKLARYGPKFVEVISKFCQTTG